MIATCLVLRPSSLRSIRSRACCGCIPAVSSSIPSVPYMGFEEDWCAIAATPPLIVIVRLPVAKALDWTAIPSSPVVESRATMENVPSGAASAG
jgi:hypothetical protein